VTADEPWPVLVLRQPTQEELDKHRRSLFVIQEGELVRNFDEDERFVNELLVDARNAEVKVNGAWEALDPKKHEDWKALIPRAWKCDAAVPFGRRNVLVRPGQS